jgi:uncharacterized membrane protein
MTRGETTARGLGYFSLGLGLAQLAAPGAVAQLIGLHDGQLSRLVLRALGARELMAGFGTLAQQRPAQWLWARAAGDAMDAALVARALLSRDNDRPRLAATFAAVVASAALDLQTAEQLMNDERAEGLTVVKGITINRAPDEVERFWHDFTRRPGVTEALRSAQFRSAPGGRGTEVRVEARHAPPSGGLLAALRRLTGRNLEQQLQTDLRRAKQLLETGEVTQSEATVASAGLFQHAGQPHAGQPNALAGSHA